MSFNFVTKTILGVGPRGIGDRFVLHLWSTWWQYVVALGQSFLIWSDNIMGPVSWRKYQTSLCVFNFVSNYGSNFLCLVRMYHNVWVWWECITMLEFGENVSHFLCLTRIYHNICVWSECVSMFVFGQNVSQYFRVWWEFISACFFVRIHHNVWVWWDCITRFQTQYSRTLLFKTCHMSYGRKAFLFSDWLVAFKYFKTHKNHSCQY